VSQAHWLASERSSLSLYVLRTFACISLTSESPQTPSEEILDEDGNVMHAQPLEKVSFNLDNLRSHFA
jgi:hypothetical protein